MANLHCDPRGFKKLLKLAREDLIGLRADLADIVCARVSAQSGREALEKQMCTEKALMRKSGDASINYYVDDVRARLCSLDTALMALSKAETGARSRLEDAMDQVAKFERLLKRNERLASGEGVAARPLTASDVFTAKPSTSPVHL
ncbi:MAG: hypothetical protein AAFX54_16750 [Pseudomonadota bacterium]